MPIAVVTGAASGIGQATADHFEEIGWSVLRLDRSAVAGALAADVTDLGALEAAAATLEGQHVDALVCAAGVLFPEDNRYSAVDLELWDRTQEVNVKGTVLTLRAFAPMLGPSSSVTTVASMAALAGVPRRDAYTASKGAIVALTRAWAADLIRLGIRVNAVAPGVVATPMTADTRQDDAVNLPLGRAATPHEIARVIVSISDPEASYLNGAVIPIDGGTTSASRLVPVSPRKRIAQ